MLYSQGYDTHSEYEDEDEDEQDEEDAGDDSTEDEAAPPRLRRAMESQRVQEKKPLTVDAKGIPYGALVKAFEEDLRLIGKDLDPCTNFPNQQEHVQSRFFKRVYAGQQPHCIHDMTMSPVMSSLLTCPRLF